jgi:hypothetical protein
MSTETDAGSSVRQGVDIDAFQRFRNHAKANPDDVQFEFEATGVYEGRAVHTKATTGPFTLGGQRIDRIARQYTYHFGAHREVEDALGFVHPTDREEVIECTLAALTGCINAVVSMSALARGIELDRLETTVRISWNPFVFLTLKDAEGTDQFSDLRIELVVGGKDLTEHDVAFLQEAVERSAVYNLVTMAHRSSPVVRLAEGVTTK